ncbi:hypothetical protein ACFQ34_10020 [Pseudonocardia benzenivorans]|uniref:Uncharacterized protein n=2 Tax=Pseudonocardia TaxID=1847 RepID=F4CXS7_PSEUX|nr:hypothetical protein [Pseudonocardia dioxanivorans]AEA28733.1 hypothetical protein Psed_6645 [Pseudonocardia dioxanivorans CB1190]
MTDQMRGVGAVVARRRVMLGVEDSGPFPGRHASRTEIAAETPIFHSLTVGGWRSRQHEPAAEQPRRRARTSRESDPLTEFRRDPLTAPVPAQAYTAAAAQAALRTGRHGLPEAGARESRREARREGGRHSRYEAAMRSGAAMGW